MMFLKSSSPSQGVAAESAPSEAESFLAEGYAAWAAGDESAATAAFLKAKACDSDSTEATAALAELSMAAGRFEEAATLYRQATARAPERWTWRIGRAAAESAAGRIDESVVLWRRLAENRPDSAAARRGLAQDLARLGRRAEAISEYQEASQLDPEDDETRLALAALLIEQEEPTAALERLQPTLRRDPDSAETAARMARGYALAARAWLILGETAKARQALRRGGELGGLDATQEQATEADESPQPPTPAYVRALFDSYADRFDRDLTERLAYCAPDLLRAAVEALNPGRVDLRILDLGCGSGLAGAAFRSMAGRLVGVDLAPRMVEKARARGVYDDLAIGDLLTGLRTLRPETAAAGEGWDLVIAADVLVYLGDLAETFRAVAAALAPGGRFAATVERADSPNDYILQPSRRYAHSAEHVRATLTAAGLTVERLSECSSRREKGRPVPGLLILARKIARPR